jgi:general secretion pathway protein K
MRRRSVANLWRGDRARRRPRDGFVIVAVLWILIMLAGLAVVYSTYLANTALAVQVNDAGVQVEALASAGVELAAYRLTTQTKGKRETHGQFGVRLGQATVSVRYVSEAARIDLNAADKRLLAGLFTALGARDDDADFFADRIVEWRTPQKPNTRGNQSDISQTAAASNSAGGATLAHVDELWLVPGLPATWVERALPFVTVYSGRPDIDILDAAPQVLAALPDMTPDRVHEILNRRSAASSSTLQSAADLTGSAVRGATIDAGDTFRIGASIVFDNGRRAQSEVVILVSGDDDDVPYRVLSWHDDAEVALSQSRMAVR